MTTNFVTVEELRDASIGIDLSTYSDTTLSGMLTRATARAEKFVGYSFPYETITNEKTEGQVDTNYDFIICPKKIPVRSFDALTIRKGSFSATVNLTDGSDNRYDIVDRGDMVYVSGDVVTFDSVSLMDMGIIRDRTFFTEITYKAGYYLHDRPQDLVDAITLLAQDELVRANNPGGVDEVRQGSVTIKYSNQSNKFTHKSDKVLDAEQILTLYQRTTGW